jgi:hypothetical protein
VSRPCRCQKRQDGAYEKVAGMHDCVRMSVNDLTSVSNSRNECQEYIKTNGKLRPPGLSDVETKKVDFEEWLYSPFLYILFVDCTTLFFL